ncbi:hypothetical protein, partial [Phocaeicola vulgatus]|uniref:hypothetical protein n=1 Tax=Phocaeicola vulgatus TaxID=821 RepID=UPI000FF09058
VLIEASGLEEVPEAFFVSARVKCDLYRFFPWVWVPFPRNSPEGAGFYLELEKGLNRLYFIISL